MKKLFVILACMVASVATYAQGTVNFSTRQIPDVDVKIPLSTGGFAEGADYTAQLYGGPAGSPESALVPLTPTTALRTGAAAGYVVPAGSVAVPGVAEGSRAALQLRVWASGGPNAGGGTFDTSLASGKSNIFDSPPLGGTLTTPPNLIGLTAFTVNVVPEPTTIALGILGAFALLLRRRK
jgi:hypothetical protein